jgi:hypothetical protein
MHLMQEVPMRCANMLDFAYCRSDAGRLNQPQGRAGWKRACAALVFAAALACLAQDGHPAANPASGEGTAAQAATATQSATQVQTAAGQATKEKAPAAEGERKKLISDESSQLLAMAVALKAEVDKTNKDMLSLAVIRKADEIEKLAHTVKEKIKQGPDRASDVKDR